MKNLGLLILVSFCFSAKVNAQYWNKRTEGWFWYEIIEHPVPKKVIKKQVVKEVSNQKHEILTLEPAGVTAHKKLQEDLKTARSIAIMEPTFTNVVSYLRIQREVMERSATFADVWQRVVWTTPELDYQYNNRPTNAAALRTWENSKRKEQGGLLAKAAQNHGLFFLFDDDCTYCEQMSITLRRISLRHGFEVQAVAVGEFGHHAFPTAWPDNGFAKGAGIKDFPALVLGRFSNGAQEITPIGFGVLGEAEIEQRIEVLSSVEVGTRF